MAGHANPGDDPADAEAMARHATALADALEAAIPTWVVRVVGERCRQAGIACDEVVGAAAARAGRAARDDGMPRLRRLLATDVDEQRSNPLAVVRSLVRYPTEVLTEAGVPPVVRDEFAERNFPDDVYDLTPAAFADVDQALHEPGLVWGAAKAHLVLARRRREGRR